MIPYSDPIGDRTSSAETGFPFSTPAIGGLGAKIGKATRRKSIIADAEFLRRYEDWRKGSVAPEAATTTVSEALLPSPLPASSPSPLPFTSLTVPFVYRDSKTGAARSKIITRAVSEWRGLGDTVTAAFLHDALALRGEVIAFTANLDWKTIERAYKASSFIDHLRRQVHRELRQTFGDGIQWWFALEEVWDADLGKHRPHIHGEIVIPGLHAIITDAAQHERWRRERFAEVRRRIPQGFNWSDNRVAKKLRRALRRAAGEWPLADKTRQFQSFLVPNADRGWASYCVKNSWKARPGIREMFRRLAAGVRYELSFEGKALTATGALKHEAEAIYDRLTDRSPT